MNRIRRREISELVKELQEIEERLGGIFQRIDEINYDETEYRECMPENLQGGERYCASEEASNNLDEAYRESYELSDYIENVIGCLEEAMA